MPHAAAFVKLLRQAELDAVADRFPAHSKVLELGAGAGWQAKALQEMGHDVTALDYAHPGFQALRDQKVFPIGEYDGVHIPYPDASFDVVFSSNVLEHVAHEHELQREINRVLRPGGIAIHIVPSPAWRLWSWLSHYLFVLKLIMQKLPQPRKREPACTGGDARSGHATAPRQPVSDAGRKKNRRERFAFYLLPERHGEDGNFLTEIWHFSRWRWGAVFGRAGFSVIERRPIGLFYTGYGVLGEKLGIGSRRCLGQCLGHATTLYVIRKPPIEADAQGGQRNGSAFRRTGTSKEA